MNKNIFYYALFLSVLILLIASCAKSGNIPTEIKDTCSNYATSAAKDACYAASALSSNNPSSCSKSLNPDLCLATFWRETGNPGACALADKQNAKDDCFRFAAAANNDSGFCSQISSSEIKDGCNYNLARAKRDLALCAEIQKQQAKDSCLAIEMPGKQLSSCNGITNSTFKDICYRQVGIEKQDIGICNQIASQEIKDLCLNAVAIVKQDIKICENIATSEIKGICLERAFRNQTIPQR